MKLYDRPKACFNVEVTDQAEPAVSNPHADHVVGYQVAASLYMQENAIVWSRFNIMVTVHSILLTAVGVALSADRPLKLLAYSLPALGIILCFVWHCMMERGFRYHEIWRAATLHLEERLDAEVMPVRCGQAYRTHPFWSCFASTRDARWDDRKPPAHIKLAGHERGSIDKIRAKWISHIVILTFGGMHIVALVQALLLRESNDPIATVLIV